MNWIVGDCHGQLKALDALVNEVRKRDSNALFHFVGDFIDRGPDSKGVVDLVMTLPGSRVRGNHDDVMDLILNDRAMSPSSGEPNEAANQTLWFMNYGMAGTMESYGVKGELLYQLCDAVENSNKLVATSQEDMFRSDTYGLDAEKEDAGDAEVNKIMAEIRDCIPDLHKRFFRELPVMSLHDEFFTLHAHIPISVNATKWGTETTNGDGMHDAIWGRFDMAEIPAAKSWGKFGYFGHTPTKYYGVDPAAVVFGEQMALVDTGCAFGSRLTAFCHETKEVIQTDPEGQVS